MPLYTCLIESHENDEAFIQGYWAYADHLGDAISEIIIEAKNQGILNPIPRQVDPYDILNLQCDVVYGQNGNVFYNPNRHYFPFGETAFRFPYGIIPSAIEGEFDPDEIVVGYDKYDLQDGMRKISVNCDEGNLLVLYQKILESQNKYRVLMLELCDHYENGESASIYVNESLNNPALISQFLINNQVNVLENGHISLISYLQQGRTNIKLTDHKMIEISGYDIPLMEKLEEVIIGLKVSYMDRFVSIDNKIHHWHYRPKGSLDKKSLIQKLLFDGFSKWK